MLEVELLPELADKPERVITLDEAGLAGATAWWSLYSKTLPRY